jgi:hypothetical protein
MSTETPDERQAREHDEAEATRKRDHALAEERRLRERDEAEKERQRDRETN